MMPTCERRGCDNPVVDDGAWAPGEERTCCALHRQHDRLRSNRCPNCGGPLEERPIINDLTGRPRTSRGLVPMTRRACPAAACGYSLRPKREERR